MGYASPVAERTPRALLVGAGSLGRAVLRRLRDRESPVTLVGVTTGHQGTLMAADGVEAGQALVQLETEGLPDETPAFEELLEKVAPEVVLECIPQNIRSAEPALGMHRLCLDRDIHVVTANKAPVALAYRDLRERAQGQGVQLRFEATILDGLPLFRWFRAMPDVRIDRVRGILNATSSMVLESVGEGGTRARGLARAQARGIAEADSILDLDGWDAAAKAALLANVWMDGSLRVVDVKRSGCDQLKDKKIQEAAEGGLRYRLVVTVERGEAGPLARVEPEALKDSDPLYGFPGSRGAVTVTTDQGTATTLVQTTSGLDDAAFGMISDVRAIRAGLPPV